MMVWFGRVVEAVPLIEEYLSYEAAGMSIRFGSLKAKKPLAYVVFKILAARGVRARGPTSTS